MPLERVSDPGQSCYLIKPYLVPGSALYHPPATFSNGAAYADLDRDGDLELVINRLNEPALLYENRARQLLPHHYLTVQLTGHPPPGAKVVIQAGGKRQMAEYSPARGFQSSAA